MEKSPNIVESHHIVKIDAKPQVVLLIAPGLVVVESRLHCRLEKVAISMMKIWVIMTTMFIKDIIMTWMCCGKGLAT